LSSSTDEQNQNGILAMLDEECLRPGTVTDITFLDKLNTVCAEHQHFESRLSKNSKFLTDHSLPHSCFRIQHYAGKVRGTPRAGEHTPRHTVAYAALRSVAGSKCLREFSEMSPEMSLKVSDFSPGMSPICVCMYQTFSKTPYIIMNIVMV
jgi:hypothetical protein